MAGVQETAQWENHVYRIEENDPVHGGEDGVTNKPIKHLANRTLYLRKLLTEAGQRINPKKITASSRNSNDLTGHTHEIDLASLTTKGLVQLTNDTGLDSEVLALTAKGGKAIAQSVAQLQQRMTTGLNQKVDKASISDSVSSDSQTTVASSRGVKIAYDKGMEAKSIADNIKMRFTYVSNAGVTLDASKRSDWVREMKMESVNNRGYYTQSFYGSASNRQYSNFPITTTTHFNVELFNQAGFSFLRITYPVLRRTFETAINLNNEDLVLDWIEVAYLKDGVYQGHFKATGTLESDFRLRAIRSAENAQPYLRVVDMGYDLISPPSKNKIIGSVDYYVKNGDSESPKVTMMAAAMPDKNTFWEVALWGEEQQRKVLFKGYSKTNNLSIGKTNDNERDRLQVNGTIGATAPADNANNDQLPTTAWVRRLATTIAESKVNKSGDTMTGILDIKNGNYSSINQWNLSSRHARSETLPDTDSNFFKISYRADNGNTELDAVHFPKRGVGKNVAYEDWVNESYVPRNGDTTINGRHFFKNNKSWISIISTASAESGIDFTNQNGKHAQASIRAVDVGGFADELRFLTTPPGSNYETDRRQHTMTLGYAGDLWTKKYGWLHDYFAKQADNNNIWNELNNLVIKRGDLIRSWYPSHYAGAEVYKIRHLGLMLTVMNTNGANGEYTLPEAYDGHAIALAQDRGDGRISLEGSRFLGGNKIKLAGRSDTNCHVLVIGFKNV